MLGSRAIALTALRIAVAGLIVIHGAARVSLGLVDEFGAFLTDQGMPLGLVVAWLVTIVEIGGGVTLAFGRLVWPLCAWFGVQLAFGIVMIHAREGWFVVGAGRNGMEYSVLLLVCLGVIALGRR